LSICPYIRTQKFGAGPFVPAYAGTSTIKKGLLPGSSIGFIIAPLIPTFSAN
jgi:hypothetical protein